MAMSIKITIIWVMALCNLVGTWVPAGGKPGICLPHLIIFFFLEKPK
jgi:hypothetical protein